MEDLTALTGLIRAHAGTPCRKVLVCARDVWEAVEAAGLPAALAQPLEFSPCELTGTEVIVAPGYAAGRWKLIRHDSCLVVGLTPLGREAASHACCTVLGENWLQDFLPTRMSDPGDRV
jgi:hypothetical protein